jgi:hypothetical protein
VTQSSVSFVWDAVTGASKYVLQRRLAGDQSFTTVSDTITGTTFTDSGLSPEDGLRVSAERRRRQRPELHADGGPPVTTSDVGQFTPVIVMADASLVEPPSGTADMLFTVTLSASATQAISLHYATTPARRRRQ